MRILSEKTGKEYDTVPECLAAEKEFDEAQAKEKERKEALVKERKARAKEVEEALKAVCEAQKVYQDKLNAFLKDYKGFHLTIRDSEKPSTSIFEDLFNTWFSF